MLVTVDTGGTKTLVWVFDERGQPVSKLRFPTPQDSGAYLVALGKEIKDISERYEIDAIAIATPGLIKDGVIIWGGGNLAWENVAIQKAIEKVVPGVPVLVENDAKLGGLGEVRLLDPVPEICLYVTISTGIGVGLMFKGELDQAMRFSEAGHSLIEYDGVVQEWEKFASGQAVYKAYGKYAKDITSKRTWLAIADRISRGFLALIPAIAPDAIIIGGSMGSHFSKYDDLLTGILKERLPAHIPCPKFIAAKHPEEAVIYGCYYYAIDTLSDRKTH